MSAATGQRTLREVVWHIVSRQHGMGTRQHLVQQVRDSLTVNEYQQWEEELFSRACAEAFWAWRINEGRLDNTLRQGEAPSPAYLQEWTEFIAEPELPHGSTAALRSFSVADFRAKARALIGDENVAPTTELFEKVQALADVCQRIHGRSFSVQRLAASERGVRVNKHGVPRGPRGEQS